jgi:hypothetical protein
MAFMTRDAQTRLDNVRNDIVARTAAPYRADMTTWINNYWTTNHNNNPALRKQLSDLLTITDVANSGDSATRAKRRVLIFLEAQKMNSSLPVAKTSVGNLAAPLLDARITPLIDKLTIQANQQYGNGALIQNKFLNELKAHPDIFLQNERLNSGSIGAAANNFFFYDYSKDQYKIDMSRPVQYPHAYSFDAVTIPGVFWLNVPNRTNVPNAGSFASTDGTELDGNDVMISTMFSGCSFAFKQENVGGRIWAAHIMPDDGNGHVIGGAGTGLANQLAGQVPTVAAGNFTGSAAGNFRVYGAGYSNLAAPLHVGYPVRTALDEFMNVFGTRIGGIWQIWSQHINGANKQVFRLF